MKKDQGKGDFIDGITGFAMRQASRRGFIKWMAKGGVALAAGITAGFEWFTGTTLAGGPQSIDCQHYLPGCEGDCTCAQSCCTDPDNEFEKCCEGICPSPCGPPIVKQYYADVFWYWSGTKGYCVQASNCLPC